MAKPVLVLLTLLYSISGAAQKRSDTLTKGKGVFVDGDMHYKLPNGETLVYSKPKKWAFITNLPSDAGGIVSRAFKKESIKPWAAIAGSTALLLWGDQAITDNFRDFADNIGLKPDEKNYNVIIHTGSKDIALLRFPGNLNTAFYQAGQGFPPLVIGAGLFIYGKTHNDYRALSTASQLTESFILMGVGTQLVKRMTGRQSPSESNTPGGNWHPFPSFSQYQNNTPEYDAFPSGHLATLVSSITIFSQNYPEKKWIKPIGYSISGLVCLSMINNKVHWASDYPLAIGMGYLCARQVVKRNQRILRSNTSAKKKDQLDFTVNYLNGTVTPGLIYKF